MLKIDPFLYTQALHAATVEIISLRPGSVRGMNILYPGKKVDVDRTVFTATASAYDALLQPGGFINPDFLRQSENALEFVREFERAGKPIRSKEAESSASLLAETSTLVMESGFFLRIVLGMASLF